jgi:hypothetical protein
MEQVTNHPQDGSQTEGEQPQAQEGVCCGRKASLCHCISAKTLFTITTIVGAALLVLGVLAIIGYCAPASGGGSAVLQKIHFAASLVATKMGSDLFTLAMFATSFGTALTLTGVVGLCIERRSQKPALKAH